MRITFERRKKLKWELLCVLVCVADGCGKQEQIKDTIDLHK